MVALQGGRPPFQGNSPHLRPQPLRVESSPTRSKILPPPTARGLGPTRHASWSRGEEAKPPRARGACNHPAVTSTPPLSPRPAGERADSHAGGMQPCRVGAPSTPTCPAWRSRPTRHATGAPVATCEQLHRHSRHYRTSSTTESIPRLEATLQCQPSATVKCGQKWAGSNGGDRRAAAAVTSSAKLTSHPGAAGEPSLTT
jgi:hypothetical protein